MDEDETTTTDAPKDGEAALGDAGKRALDAERKARGDAERRAKEAEARIKALEDEGKSELERLQGQVAELTKRAEGAESKADRFEVAAAKGLSLAQARRLVGSTKEELEADAEEMRTELGLNDSKDDTPAPASKPRPKEDLKPGASNTEDDAGDPKKIADEVLKSAF